MNLLFAQFEATGKYIRKDLRPLILSGINEGAFQKFFTKEDQIFNALSTTKIRKIILSYFNEEFPHIKYERVSFYPINPENKIDTFHRYILTKRSLNKSPFPWRGFISWQGENYLILVKPIYVEKSCLLCHGALKDMPLILKRVYNLKEDFPYKTGELMGIELIRYPVKEALNEIKHYVLSLFTLSIVAIIVLFLSLEGLFYALFLKPIQRLRIHFLNLKSGKTTLDNPLCIERKDEIGELFEAFNELSSHLYISQKTLKENFKTLKTLFDSITQPLALFNKNCEPELANEAYYNFSYAGCFPEYLTKVMEEKKEIQEIIKTEEGKYFLLSLYPVFNEKREVMKVVQLIEDLTEQKKMEEQLILTEKLAAIGHLATGLAHEINNPLSGILLILKNLQKGNLSEEEKMNHINLLESGLLRIQNIVKDLLNFSRTTEIKREHSSINILLEEVLELCSYLFKKNQVTVIKDFDPHLPEVKVDREKMEQVFLNLILNALFAMEHSEERKLILKTYIRDKKICITFEDTGPGIPEAIVSKIFDPFFTTKPPNKGTGLGLTVSLAIVKMHGGNLILEKYKEGAIFTIELPLN